MTISLWLLRYDLCNSSSCVEDQSLASVIFRSKQGFPHGVLQVLQGPDVLILTLRKQPNDLVSFDTLVQVPTDLDEIYEQTSRKDRARRADDKSWRWLVRGPDVLLGIFSDQAREVTLGTLEGVEWTLLWLCESVGGEVVEDSRTLVWRHVACILSI